ncbi:MAG TPA: FAD-binding protein, partial [Pseudonocardiaceae bacterium]|nr:FAD-binding protein [Pseudonocardiaceae bacterium]
MADSIAHELAELVGDGHVLVGDAISPDYQHDEALSATPVQPGYLVRPSSAAEIAGVVKLAREHRVPITARGSGTGM